MSAYDRLPTLQEPLICVDVLDQADPAIHAQLLPEIERSAGKAFLDIPDLAWIADDEVRSEAWHRHHISMDSSWIVSALDGTPVEFENQNGGLKNL